MILPEYILLALYVWCGMWNWVEGLFWKGLYWWGAFVVTLAVIKGIEK